MGPDIPKQKDPKTQASPVNVSPLQARTMGPAQPLPRQMLGQGAPSAGASMVPGGQSGRRYDQKAVMELLKRGGGGGYA